MLVDKVPVHDLGISAPPPPPLVNSILPVDAVLQEIDLLAKMQIPDPNHPLNLRTPYPPIFRDEIRMIQMTFGPLANPTPNHTSLVQILPSSPR